MAHPPGKAADPTSAPSLQHPLKGLPNDPRIPSWLWAHRAPPLSEVLKTHPAFPSSDQAERRGGAGFTAPPSSPSGAAGLCSPPDVAPAPPPLRPHVMCLVPKILLLGRLQLQVWSSARARALGAAGFSGRVSPTSRHPIVTEPKSL